MSELVTRFVVMPIMTKLAWIFLLVSKGGHLFVQWANRHIHNKKLRAHVIVIVLLSGLVACAWTLALYPAL